MPAEETKNI